MNLNQLRAFHRVAEAGSFTAAARDAGLSQPTLSAQVRALEVGHAVSLLNRRGRRVTLTPLGQTLFEVTSRLFAIEDEARALLAGAVKRGHLRVAADSATHVMPLLAELKRRRPGLSFSVRIGNSSDVLQQIQDYDADVAVTAKQTSDPRIHSVPLRLDRLVLFVSLAHPWRDRLHISMADLAGQDLVIRERGSITREVFELRLAEAHVRPATLIEVQSREAVRDAVAANFGIGVVFESELGGDDALRPIDIQDADLTVAEYIVCLEERRRMPLVRNLLELVSAARLSSDC